MTDDITTSFIPTSPEDVKQIAGVIKDISDMKAMQKGYAESINAHKKALKEDWGYDMKTINLLINWYHNQEAEKAQEVFDETQNIYDALFPTKTSV